MATGFIKHWFASSVWNFCRWVADVPPRETSPAAKSEEKRMFSQARVTIAWWLWSIFTLQKLPLNSDIDSRFPRQKNLGPYLKLLGILKLENLVKLKIATFISQIRNKGHLFSELLLSVSYIHLACEPQTYVCGSQANIHSHSTRYTTQDNCYRIHARTNY